LLAIVHHLYRKSAGPVTGLLLVVLLLFSFVPVQAQRPEMRRPQSEEPAASQSAPAKKSKRGPRAIAVLEMLPGGAARLVPVALWMDGKYYDASLYGASPEPFALRPGTVYEAQNYGETAGTFVVRVPKLVGGNWAADGQWKPYGTLDAKVAAEKAKHPQPKPKDNKAIFTGGPDEGPPVLRRTGGSGDQPAASTPASSQTPAAPGQADSQPQSGNSKPNAPSSTQPSSTNSGRPTLKRPSEQDDSSSSSSTSSGQSQSSEGSVTVSDPNRPVMHRAPASESSTTASDDDPDRPVFRKPTAQPPSAQSATPGPNYSSDDNDPNRPVLSHDGKAAASVPKVAAPAPTVTTKNQKPSPNTPVRLYPAISDAGNYTNRSFLYPMTPEEQQQKAPALFALALNDIRAFAAKRPGPQVPKSAAITDYDLRGYDLDLSNTPTLVLTAKLPVASTSSKPFAYYATIVARLDINGDPQKIFSSITDTTHLDAYPRLELVDALDADANGRGDLLFRQYSDTGVNYGLYRVFPYNIEKVFEGGSSL
jgi:hypothetical protein